MGQILLKDRLKSAIEQSGTNPSELAKLAGVKPSFIYDVLNGKSSNPNVTKLAQLCPYLRVSLSELLDIPDAERKEEKAQSEYVAVSSILVTATAAGGVTVVEEQQGDPYYFRRSWVRDSLGVSPQDLRMIFVQGDSMEPTLCSGDMILVDISKRNPSPAGIFVLFDGLGLIVKRLEYIVNSQPAAVRILSDNPQYHAYEHRVEDINIIGRVVWFAREI